jgi:hypothetical protein
MMPMKDLSDKQTIQARSERRPAPQFVAYHSTGATPKQEDIKDISSTGIYLLTEERWLPGTPVLLTIQKRGPLEENGERKVTLRATSARWGEDGVGLSFTLPKDVNFDLWESVLESAADHREAIDILGPLRMAESSAFLTRICPSKAEEIRRLLRGGLGNLRVVNAVEIALKAEVMVDHEPDSELMRANTHIVFRVLEDGSWADEDWIKQLWSGLLATSCSADGREKTDTTLVDRFAQLAPVHVRIFKEACSKATKFVSETGTLSAKPLIYNFEALQKVSGSKSHAGIERDVHHLSSLDLFIETVGSGLLQRPEQIEITPSVLGLTMYARCNGHRGALEDFYFPAY